MLEGVAAGAALSDSTAVAEPSVGAAVAEPSVGDAEVPKGVPEGAPAETLPVGEAGRVPLDTLEETTPVGEADGAPDKMSMGAPVGALPVGDAGGVPEDSRVIKELGALDAEGDPGAPGAPEGNAGMEMVSELPGRVNADALPLGDAGAMLVANATFGQVPVGLLGPWLLPSAFQLEAEPRPWFWPWPCCSYWL